MGKKILIVITIVLIAGLSAGWYFFAREAKYLGTSAFRAMPESSAMIVRIHHLKKYTAKSLNNPFWKAYTEIPVIGSLYHNLSAADSLLNLEHPQNNALTDIDLTIGFSEKNNNFNALYLVELSGMTGKYSLSDLITKYFTPKGVAPQKSVSGGADLTSYSWDEKGEHHTFCTTFYHGLFIAATDHELVIQAVGQLNAPVKPGISLFEKANKTATENIDMNIYLNHRNLPQFTRQLFSDAVWSQMESAAPLAEWSEIDLTQKTDELLLNGFSFTGDSLNTQLSVFLHQKPDTFHLAALFPAESTFFLGYVISDNEKFFSDYEHLLSLNNQLKSYKKSLGEVESGYGVDLQKVVIENLEKEAAIVFTQPDPVMEQENKYLVMSTVSGSRMENAMTSLSVLVPGTKKREKPKKFISYKIDNETLFKIYKTSVNDLGKRVFGDVFSCVETNYFTFYDNYLIMGTSVESLGRFLRANVVHETLGNEQTYRKFNSGLSDRLNISLWSTPCRALPFFQKMISAGSYQNLEKKRDKLQKIESVAWQIGVENGMTYNMARIKYNADVHENSTNVGWKSHLGNRVITRPLFVTNFSSKGHPEIMVQDSSYNLSLFTGEGRLLWKVKLKGPVQSEIFQLESLKKGQKQFFFSTGEALHMIDHKGNYLPQFPLMLRSPATNGVSVADYDHNRDYRFFIACKDHKVYLYDKKGKMVTGWAPPKTEHNVYQPVQYFRVEKKDYLIFTDKNKGYLLDRKGKPTVIKGDITFSHNCFTLRPKSGKTQARLITTDAKGNIVSIGFDGSVKKMPTGNFSPGHYFIYEDFNSDNQRDYLFFDGDSLVVYDQNVTRIFSRKFTHPLLASPELFTFPDQSRKIGITDPVDNKIYLFNSDGSSYKGFPIEGNTPFGIYFSGGRKEGFNLITGTSGGDLIQYQIK